MLFFLKWKYKYYNNGDSSKPNWSTTLNKWNKFSSWVLLKMPAELSVCSLRKRNFLHVVAISMLFSRAESFPARKTGISLLSRWELWANRGLTSIWTHIWLRWRSATSDAKFSSAAVNYKFIFKNLQAGVGLRSCRRWLIPQLISPLQRGAFYLFVICHRLEAEKFMTIIHKFISLRPGNTRTSEHQNDTKHTLFIGGFKTQNWRFWGDNATVQ